MNNVQPGRPVYELKAELYKSLGHPARIRVLELLQFGEVAVSELIQRTGLEASHLSQHLAVLRKAGVVLVRRQGNQAYYRLSDPSVEDLLAASRRFLLNSLETTQAHIVELEQEGSR